MIEAILMVGERLAGVYPLKYPMSRLVLESAFLLTSIESTAISTTDSGYSPATELARSKIHFDLVDRIGYDKYVYQYRQAEFYEKYTANIMANVLPIEPTNVVNLNMLKNKFRKGEKMKELLISFFNSED